MRVFPSKRSALMMVGAFLALFASEDFVSSRAVAGCGGYAVSSFSRERHLAEAHQQQLSPLVISLKFESREADESKPQMPCRGPSCSGKPSKPALPVAPSLPLGDRWCCSLPQATLFSDRQSLAFLRDDASPHPKTRADAIDHPPRMHLAG